MENNKNQNLENQENMENKDPSKEENKEKKVSFKLSKDLTKEEIAKLPKVIAKIVRSTNKKKRTSFAVKFKLSTPGKDLVIQKQLDPIVADLVVHNWGKTFDRSGEAMENLPIRFSKGEKEGEVYYAYDLFLTNKRRLFDFFSSDEMEYIETYGFKLNFEERKYFDEDGYEYKPSDF